MDSPVPPLAATDNPKRLTARHELVPNPVALSRAALAVADERLRQVTRYGHSAEADDAAPRQHLLRLGHVFLLDAADLLSRRPGPAELTRVRRKAIQAAALCLAEIERIDRELVASE